MGLFALNLIACNRNEIGIVYPKSREPHVSRGVLVMTKIVGIETLINLAEANLNIKIKLQ